MRFHARFPPSGLFAILPLLALAMLGGACGDSSADDGARPAGSRPGGSAGAGRGNWGAPGGAAASTAVPVELATVERRSISFYIQSNGTLEAENEVDIVARTSGPIEELRTEEGRSVSANQLLARIEDDEIRAQVEITRVALEEARLNYERARQLYDTKLLSPEAYEQARSRFETAQAQYQRNQVQLAYTEIRAPFAGLVITRYIDQAQQVAVGTPLFRISDFDPLLCPVQVPERELPRLAVGQRAYLTVEAYPNARFDATVLRVSPVIDARTGTVKVTLDVRGEDKLRPGMFARVFLETETHDNAVVVPKKALSLESLGDTVFVYREGVAERREVELGFEEGDLIEIVSGLSPGEQVVVVGQDGLSDGTPIQVLQSGARPGAESATAGAPERPDPDGRPGLGRRTPEDLERVKERMRSQGLSETEIEERLERMRSGRAPAGGSREGETSEPAEAGRQ